MSTVAEARKDLESLQKDILQMLQAYEQKHDLYLTGLGVLRDHSISGRSDLIAVEIQGELGYGRSVR